MRWEDERYVKSYTRDTTDWLALSFEAQGVWLMLLRKFDGAGIIDLGRHGKRGIAIAIGHAHRWKDLEPAVDELLADGCLVIEGQKAIGPNFVEAQEARASDAARKRAQRERDRDLALAGDAKCAESLDTEVTPRHAESRAVTRGHAKSHEVTLSSAQPSSAKLSPAQPKNNDLSAGADAGPVAVAVSEPDDPVPAVPTPADVARQFADPASPVNQPLLVAVPPPPPDPRAAQAREVFEHWRRVMGRSGRTEFDAKRRRAVEARLKGGYSVADLCRAIDGCAVTPWNNGTETGKRYDDLELICRDAAHVDRFITHAASPPPLKTGSTNPAVDAAFQPREDW